MFLIPAVQEVEIRKMAVQGQPGQKVSKIPSQQISKVLWSAPVAQPHGRPYIGHSGLPRQKCETLSKT
jgi:hypothetical protein